MKKKKIVTFGEIMLRLSSPGRSRLRAATQLDVCYGGGEANVAVNLSELGMDASFVTKLPKNDFGEAALGVLRSYGVDTRYIARGGERLGIYFLESGSAVRPSKVVYDRAHSAISEADPEDFDFDAIMQGKDWFHWTGITPALSNKSAKLTELALKAAKRQGVKVSVDLNFRKKLWSPEKAQSVMRPLMEYVDVCIGNEEDADKCLGFKPQADVLAGKTDEKGYENIFREMKEQFGFEYIASSLRESFSASHNGWKALIYDGTDFCVSRRYDLQPIVDRVGGGDAFAAGLIYGLLTKDNQQDAVNFAVANSALKHTIPGDFNQVTIEEVEQLAGGDGSGRVQR